MKKRKLFGFGKMPQEMPAPQTAPAAEPKQSYASRYLKRNRITTRQCVYISHDIHGIIARLVRQLANQGQEITVGGYIDTVLSEHLQANKEEINEVYRSGSDNLL
jgi:hypothetical protein